MKTYAPKELRGDDLRGLLDDLAASPLQVSKFLKVTERSVWRWLADASAPFAVLAALWHETPHGRHVTALDVGNELVIVRGLAKSFESQATRQAAQLAKVLAISDTGAANSPIFDLVLQPGRDAPFFVNPGLQLWKLAHDDGGHDGAPDHNDGLLHDGPTGWRDAL
jgi:hypothetical protein